VPEDGTTEAAVRLLDAPDAGSLPPRPAWEIVLFGGFCGLLILAAIFAVLPPGRPVGAGVLIVFTALVAYRAAVPAGVVLGAMAWLFDLGFVVHTEGDLGSPTGGELLFLAALAATGAITAGMGRVTRQSGRRRAGREPEPRSGVTSRSSSLVLPGAAADHTDWTGLVIPRQREEGGVRG
jgi:hypothetical protein